MADLDNNTSPPIQQEIAASDVAQIRDVIQAVVSGHVSGDLHIGNVVYSRSQLEELDEYLTRGLAACQRRVLAAAAFRDRPPARPYKSLYSFELEDAAIYFGRDDDAAALYELVGASRLTVLHAPSGTGKTSLLNAGLAPRLAADGRLPIYARAHADPVMACKRAFAPPSLGPWPELLAALPLSTLLGMCCRYLDRDVHELVIIFDQFETFFAGQLDRVQRLAFAADLATCCEDMLLPVRFVIGIRDDMFSRLSEFSGYLPQLFAHQYRLEQLTRAAAASAIQAPLRRLERQCTCAPQLLDTLLDDLARTGMEPPHLQLVCMRLYAALAPGDTELNLDHYQSIGRAAGTLGSYMRDVLDQLGLDAPLARSILVELLNSDGTRALLPQTILAARVTSRDDMALFDMILERLVAARLIRRELIDSAIYVELAHDYLLHEIRSWLNADADVTRRSRETVRRAVATWREYAVLMDPTTLEAISHHSRQFDVQDAENLELLLRSAIAHRTHIEVWMPRAFAAGLDLWALIAPALQDDDRHLRAAIADALPTLGHASISTLARMLDDGTSLVRTRAILGLKRIGLVSAQDALHANLKYEVIVPADAFGPAFMVDRSPVTNVEYQNFLVDNPEHPPPSGWYNRGAPRGLEIYPVTDVNWYDAQAYARWAGRRLLTAREWWRAAGGPSGRVYPWGNILDIACCNTYEADRGGATPVGYYSPAGDSLYGIADMAGNVWEWMEDPDEIGGINRLLCGGSWRHSANFARIDYNQYRRKPAERRDCIGFRLCFSLSSEGYT
jgi:hypothetical protein